MENHKYFIGNYDDLKEYKTNPNDIKLLPVKNLPMVYFPFFYSTSESSIEKMKRLFPLYSSDTVVSDGVVKDKSSGHNIDTEQLFASLSILEEDYQPYNKNNIYHISLFIFVCYVLLLLVLLKIVHYFFETSYSYIIVGTIGILLIISLVWAMVITGRSF